MNQDLNLSHALGRLRIANPDDDKWMSLKPVSGTPQDPCLRRGSICAAMESSKRGPKKLKYPNYPTHAGNDKDHLFANGFSRSANIDSLATRSRLVGDETKRFDRDHNSGLQSSVCTAALDSNVLRGDAQWRRDTDCESASRVSSKTSNFSIKDASKLSSEISKSGRATFGQQREIDADGRTANRQVKKGVKDFVFGRILGEGSYSTVYLATDRQTLREYAIKILEKRHIIKEKKIKYVNIEKNTLNRLTEHPGIVRLYYTFQDETSLYFVLDLCSGGELLTALKRTGSFGNDSVRFYGAQILDSISYMHSRGVIHRDLKPENVLLDEEMHVKITDFGTAKLLSDPRKTNAATVSNRGMLKTEDEGGQDASRAASFVGTAEYVSPELLTRKIATRASDIWAFGCIIYQLTTGRPPFKAGSEYLTFQKIVNLEYNFPQGFDSAARDLVEHCLILDPTERLTIQQIKDHKFFAGQHFGKTLWRVKAPRLRPKGLHESSDIQHDPLPVIATTPHSSVPEKDHDQSQQEFPQRLSRLELSPLTQLDIEWSSILSSQNERILKLGELVVTSYPLQSGASTRALEDSYRNFIRIFGISTSKRRQRLVMITSNGRIVMAPAGGEGKKSKEELFLYSPDCTWHGQQDSKGQQSWCLDTGGNRYIFEEPKTSARRDICRAFSQEWLDSLEQAKLMATNRADTPPLSFKPCSGDLSPMINSSQLNASSSIIASAVTPRHSNKLARNYLANTTALNDVPPSRRYRLSKRQSRHGDEPVF